MPYGHGSATDLTSSLRRDHEVILRMLRRLESKLDVWKSTNRVDRGSLREFLDFARTFIDRCHHGKEERCLFPCLERRGIPREGGPIGVMLYEHDLGRQLIRQIEDALKGLGQADNRHLEVIELCESYISLLRQHIEKEDNVLFPMGENVSSLEDRASTNSCYEQIESFEVGREVHEKYERLADSF